MSLDSFFVVLGRNFESLPSALFRNHAPFLIRVHQLFVAFFFVLSALFLLGQLDSSLLSPTCALLLFHSRDSAHAVSYLGKQLFPRCHLLVGFQFVFVSVLGCLDLSLCAFLGIA